MKTIAALCVGGLLISGHVGELFGDEKVATEKRELVVTVLEKPIYLDQIASSEAPEKQKQLSESEYSKWLRAYRADRLLSTISGRVLKEYALREKLSPSDDEINAKIAVTAKKSAELIESDQDAQRNLALRVFWLQASSYEWRTAKALHEKYGGRVAISSFGACTSFEGRNAVLKDYAKAGDIKFHHADLENAFWEKTKDERIQDVTLRPENVAAHFAVSPWDRWIAEQTQKNDAHKNEKKTESTPQPTASKPPTPK